MSKETQTIPQELFEHVAKMKVAVDNTLSKCVDGGYRENEAVGAMAIPGGHLGVSMALIRLGYEPRVAFDTVQSFVSAGGGRYGWHTDKHEGHHGVVCGCGHCNAAITQGEKYGVEGEKIRQLLDIVREKTEANPDSMNLVILDREHAEQGILVVTGTQFTVKPWDEAADRQYFIYDQTRHQNFLQALTPYLEEQGKQTTYDQLWEASNAQTLATLGLLGSSKGKPMYTVNVDGETAQVAFLQNAPDFA